MKFQELSLWWADPEAALAYRLEALSPVDAHRVLTVHSAKAQRDWRVSRALLQHARADGAGPYALSLSHSGGHALCARAPLDWAVGVDLERVRPRDTAALAAWVCSEPEQAWLRQGGETARLERFYLLWTLKEAFVKAAGLDFPADMASMGLAPRGEGAPTLRPPPGRWRAACWRVGADWMMAAVWRAAEGQQARLAWRTAADCVWPRRLLSGHWEGWGEDDAARAR